MANLPKLRAFSYNKKSRKFSATTVVVSSFLLVIFLGAFLLMLPFSTTDGSIEPLNALFTATSATCVTGLVVYDTFSKFTLFGRIIILTLIQIGGLGLVTFATFFNLAMGKRLGFKTLRTASEGISVSNVYEAGSLIRTIMKITFGCELLGAILLSFDFVPRFGLKGIPIAIFIAISAFCNAGFDVFGFIDPYCSLVPFVSNFYVQGVIMALIILGGIGFIVWADLFLFNKRKKLFLHTKLVLLMTVSLIILGTLGIAVMEWNNPDTLGSMSLFDKVLACLFQSVSTRTAGFNTFDLNQCEGITKLFMSALMFIGAAPGGTGGGIKVTTIAVILVTVASVCSGKREPTIFGHKINTGTVYKAVSIFFLAMMAVCVSALAIFLNTGSEINEVNSIFEAASAFGTVGLSVGATAFTQSIARTIIILTMFLGRVGPVSLMMSIAANGFNNSTRNEILPECNVVVG